MTVAKVNVPSETKKEPKSFNSIPAATAFIGRWGLQDSSPRELYIRVGDSNNTVLFFGSRHIMGMTSYKDANPSIYDYEEVDLEITVKLKR